MATIPRNDQTDNFECQKLRKLGKALRKRDRMLQQAASDKDCWNRSKALISRAQRRIRTMRKSINRNVGIQDVRNECNALLHELCYRAPNDIYFLCVVCRCTSCCLKNLTSVPGQYHLGQFSCICRLQKSPASKVVNLFYAKW